MTAIGERGKVFIVGGTVSIDSPSYVNRQADQNLLRFASEGTYCSVLTARQVGKSSLMVRTAERLRERGILPAKIDLTQIGSDYRTAEEWYLSVLLKLQSELLHAGVALSSDVLGWWMQPAQQSLSAPQRFRDFLRHIVLEQVAEPVVIFIDEIDSVLPLSFRSDFFSAIRAIYNARATDAVYHRLTFVFLGVATPAQLTDREGTPFNIGERIVLGDLSFEDADALRDGIEQFHSGYGTLILNRIFCWTYGHPYLTQKLCSASIQQPRGPWDDARVDALVAQLFLTDSDDARNESNLNYVGQRLQSRPPSEQRRMLRIYRETYQGKKVPDDDQSLVQSQLKLCGLVRSQQGQLSIRNEIYRSVFSSDWIKAHTPTPWYLRRSILITAMALLVVLAAAVYSYATFQRPQNIEAQLAIESFRESSTPAVRTQSLVRLVQLGYQQQAIDEFYLLTAEEQRALFNESTQTLPSEGMVTLILVMSQTLDEHIPNSDLLLDAMADALANLPQPTNETNQLLVMLRQWQQARAYSQDRKFDQAIAAYNNAIGSGGATNPLLFIERAQAYAAEEQLGAALKDFDAATALLQQQAENLPSDQVAVPAVSSVQQALLNTAKQHSQFIDIRQSPRVVGDTIRQNPELWEVLLEQPSETYGGLNEIDAAQRDADVDGDGISNAQEATGSSNFQNDDTDSDGLNDGKEAAAQTDPTNPDSDADGIRDGDDPAPLTTPTPTPLPTATVTPELTNTPEPTVVPTEEPEPTARPATAVPQPTDIPPTQALPTAVPVPTEVPPTDVPVVPTDVPVVPTDVPVVPTNIPPTDVPVVPTEVPVVPTEAPTGVSVPNVTGLYVDQAVAMISGAGLGVNVQKVPAGGAELGLVLGQDPGPGAVVAPGTVVTILVAD